MKGRLRRARGTALTNVKRIRHPLRHDGTMPAPIATVEDFYAHALAIEREAAERYDEFATYFEDRGEEALASLCRHLAEMESRHFDDLLASCISLKLPPVADCVYQWIEGDAPEAPAREMLYRIATPRHLLEIALAAEWRAREFFVAVARTASSLAVRELASVMAAEETEHVKWVRQALEYHVTTGANWDELIAAGIGPGLVSPD
jgi:rubrerythrin